MNANNTDKEIIEVSLDDILPNRFQPRLTFDQNSLNELSTSIREHGIIQPLVVRRLGDKFEIIAGERRYKAAILAGLKKVPVVIMSLNDNESAEIAIVENIQRKEMTPLEEAKSYKKLLDRGYLTQEQLAVRMGKSQSAIANKLRLLNLTEEVQDALLNEKISERHARSLLSVKSPEDQKKILTEILSNKLTVKQTDDLIKQRFGVNTTTEDESPTSQVKNLKAYASASTIIPNPYADNEPNPQLNLMNQLNRPQPVENSVQSNIEQQNKINPIEPTKQVNDNIIKPIELDINKLKEEAQDINKPTPPPTNMTELLTPEKPVESMPEQKTNKFIFDFDDLEPVNKPEVIAPVIPPIAEDIKNVEPGNVKSAADSLKREIDMLKSKGFRVTTEEFDYEKLYQLIIKIDK